MHMTPKVSVLLPVYNGCYEVSRAINSVLDQTFLNFELIIIDDCSTDNTVEIVTEFINRDNRIKFYKNANNLGLTRTLNIAIRKSSGSLLARIDADDFWTKDKLLKQVAYFDSNKKCVLCGTEHYILSSDNIQMKGLDNNLDPKEIVACGGGVKNKFLMQRISELTSLSVFTTADEGLDPQAIESMAFAWFGYRRIKNIPSLVPTGKNISTKALLGSITKIK